MTLLDAVAVEVKTLFGERDKYSCRYKCDWCEFEFTQIVGSTGQGHQKVSSQVVCPRCKNFIKTWE